MHNQKTHFFFRPSATVSRIGLMESSTYHCCGGPPPPGWPPLAGYPPKVACNDTGSLMESCLSYCCGGPPNGCPPWLADPPLAGYPPPHVMHGWGARPLRWLSVLVISFLSMKIRAMADAAFICVNFKRGRDNTVYRSLQKSIWLLAQKDVKNQWTQSRLQPGCYFWCAVYSITAFSQAEPSSDRICSFHKDGLMTEQGTALTNTIDLK